MKLYNIKEEYITYLSNYDSKIMQNKNEKRPYVGVIFEIKGIQYYAPFTSPKPKHLKMKNTKDFRKINAGKLGAINLNCMIPVLEEMIIQVDIAKIKDVAYRRLLQEQYRFIRDDFERIKQAANNLYQISM